MDLLGAGEAAAGLVMGLVTGAVLGGVVALGVARWRRRVVDRRLDEAAARRVGLTDLGAAASRWRGGR